MASRPNCVGDECLTLDWIVVNAYLFSPITLIYLVMAKVEVENCKVMLISWFIINVLSVLYLCFGFDNFSSHHWLYWLCHHKTSQIWNTCKVLTDIHYSNSKIKFTHKLSKHGQGWSDILSQRIWTTLLISSVHSEMQTFLKITKAKQDSSHKSLKFPILSLIRFGV